MAESVFHFRPVQPVISGLLPCWKPSGMTSRDLVNHVQRRLQLEWGRPRLTIGHLGTLDPLASGIVVIVVGTATRLTPWLMQTLKRYVGHYELGVWSESGDTEEPLQRPDGLHQPSRDELLSAALQMHGWIVQQPPGHSAIRVRGLRAYDRIRRGETVEIPQRRVWIESLNVLELVHPRLSLDVLCGSGTYLRSLGDDLAIAVGSRAVMTQLTRVSVGQLNQSDAVSPECFMTPMTGELRTMIDRDGHLDSLWATGMVHESIVPASASIKHMPRIVCSPVQREDLMQGRPIDSDPEPPTDPLPDGFDGTSLTISDKPQPKPGALPGDVLAIDGEGTVVAILRQKRGQWWPYRVIK